MLIVPTIWGERIGQFITEQRRTRTEIAAAAGVKASHLSTIINEESNPTINTLQRIATALGKDLVDLFDARPAPPAVEAPSVPPRVDLSAAVREAILDVLSDVVRNLTPAGPAPHAGGQAPHVGHRLPARHHRRRKTS